MTGFEQKSVGLSLKAASSWQHNAYSTTLTDMFQVRCAIVLGSPLTLTTYVFVVTGYNSLKTKKVTTDTPGLTSFKYIRVSLSLNCVDLVAYQLRLCIAATMQTNQWFLVQVSSCQLSFCFFFFTFFRLTCYIQGSVSYSIRVRLGPWSGLSSALGFIFYVQFVSTQHTALSVCVTVTSQVGYE